MLVEDPTRHVRLDVAGRFLEPEKKHAGVGRALTHDQLPEIFVHGAQQSLFRDGVAEDLAVAHLGVDFSHRENVVAHRTQSSFDARPDAGVDEELQSLVSGTG